MDEVFSIDQRKSFYFSSLNYMTIKGNDPNVTKYYNTKIKNIGHKYLNIHSSSHILRKNDLPNYF